MIHGNDGGATITFNGGKSWSTILNQPTAQLYHVAVDAQTPYRIYAAQQDNTTISVPSRSDHGAHHHRGMGDGGRRGGRLRRPASAPIPTSSTPPITTGCTATTGAPSRCATSRPTRDALRLGRG